MTMWLTTALLVILTTLVYMWVRNRKQKLSILRRLGIKGPEPGFILGNFTEVSSQQWRKLREWREKYGLPFGYYEGAVPIIVTKDVELIKDIFVKEFPKFHARKGRPGDSADDRHAILVNMAGDRWKRIRSITSPSFSAMKMKQMSPLINSTVDKLLKLFDQRAAEGQPFNIHGDFQKLTLDVIGSCGFGIDVNSIENPNDIFLKKCRFVFDVAAGVKKLPWYISSIFLVSVIEPKIGQWLRKILGLKLFHIRAWFDEASAKIIEQRRSAKSNRIDMVQLMLDAEETNLNVDNNQLTASVEGDDKMYINEETGEQNGHMLKKKKPTLTTEEIQSQCFVFLIAGYETTSTALGFVAHDLATNPDAQDKLRAEIDQHFPDTQCHPDYTTVQKLPYLDMVFSETLRLHPIASAVINRKCVEDCTLGGQMYPAGTVIQADVEAIHMDPVHWGPEDPKSFVPERFTPERKAARHTMAWIPFGGGPRNCIGMRFALMEAKTTLIRLMKQFVIKKCDETKVPLPTTQSGVISPSEGVTVTLEKRITA